MAKARNLVIALVSAMLMALIAFSLVACGGGKTKSYKGEAAIAVQGGSTTAYITLDEEGKVEMSMDAHSLGSATWDGTWKQNKNGTVTVTFSSAGESAIKINNNDPEAPEHPGMGSLTVTSVISGETHKLTVPLTLDVGGGWMFDLTAEFALQEVVEA